MKKIIRKGIFETNSSSSHSLVVTKNNQLEVFDENPWWLHDDGTISIYDTEFGRMPNRPLIDFYHKLQYLIAAYQYDENKLKEIEDTVKEIIPNFVKFNYYKDYNDEICYGYIDHQSAGLIPNYLEKHNISFKEFLTNKKYVIIIDGDEYGMWEGFKLAGLINEDFIEDEEGIWDYEEDY